MTQEREKKPQENRPDEGPLKRIRRTLFQRDMIRPLIYKTFTRCILTLLVILLWNHFLQPRTPHISLRIPRMKPLSPPKHDPYRSYGDMADYLDEPAVSFEDLDQEEQDVCSLAANLVCGVLSFSASFLPI